MTAAGVLVFSGAFQGAVNIDLLANRTMKTAAKKQHAMVTPRVVFV